MKLLSGLSVLLVSSLCLEVLADVPAVTTPAPVIPAPASATQPPAAAPATQAHSCAEIKAFKDGLHKAINDALRYPHAVAQHPVVGVTNIAYEYFDGKVRDARITMRSGNAMLDRTALAAVKGADYASISPRIDDEPIKDLVIIIFDNTGDMDHEPMKQKAKADQDAAEDCGG